MEQETREAMMQAMHNLIMYNFNFRQDYVAYKDGFGNERTEVLPLFLGDIDWCCNTAHMVAKWHRLCNDYGTDSALLHFYCELSNDRDKLLGWIVDNYPVYKG